MSHSKDLYIKKLIEETGEPQPGFLSLLNRIAEFSFIYNQIKENLKLPPGYNRLDIIDQEINLLWRELERIRQNLPDILIEESSPITLTKQGNVYAITDRGSVRRIRPTTKKHRNRKSHRTVK